MNTAALARRPVAWLTRAQIAELWLLRLVSLQCAPGGGPDAQLIELVVDIPGWFRAVELGLAIQAGPSILWTAENLEGINRRNRAALDAPKRAPARPHASEKRLSARERAKERRRLWRSGVPAERLQELESRAA